MVDKKVVTSFSPGLCIIYGLRDTQLLFFVSLFLLTFTSLFDIIYFYDYTSLYTGQKHRKHHFNCLKPALNPPPPPPENKIAATN